MTAAQIPALPQTLAALEGQERLLRYRDGFGAKEALELGNAIARFALEYNRGIGARIYRETDGLVLFQWMMDDKAERNIGFVDGKRRAAHMCGHCSLWVVAQHDVDGSWQDVFEPGSAACPSGGAFPLQTATGAWAGTVSLSGLQEGKDHELVVRALCDVLGKSNGAEVPIYPDVPRWRVFVSVDRK